MEEKVVQSLPEREFQSANSSIISQVFRGILVGLFVGGIVGLIGGLRIYNKWTNGDQDINKEILGWGGACLFLILVPIFVGAFFGLN